MRRPGTPLGVAALGAVLVVGVAAPALAWVALTSSTEVAVGTARLAAPTDLTTTVTATDLDAGRVRLGWQAPGGLAATGWQLERRAVGAAAWAVVSPTSGPSCAAGACTAVDTHGAAGTSFSYRVSALRHSWSGPVSEERLSASLAPVRGAVRGVTLQLHGVAVSADGDAGFAVGDGGSALVCGDVGCADDAHPDWQPTSTESTADLRAAAYVSSHRAWAVGAGAVLTCREKCSDRSSFWQAEGAAQTLLGGATATGVRAADSDPLVLVTAGPHLLRSTDDGDTWADVAAAVAAPDGVVLLGVAGPSEHEQLVVGSAGFAAHCRTDTQSCGDPGSFAPVVVPVSLNALTWDRTRGTYLAVGADGLLWRGTPGPTGITWGQDVAGSGAPAGIRSLAVATVAGMRHVWAAAQPIPGSGGSGLWHFDGLRWTAHPVTASFDPAALGGVDGGSVRTPQNPAGALPTTCAIPAVVVQVDVPAGPSPVITPTVSAGLRFARVPSGVEQAQVLASLDGITWGPPAPLDLSADAALVTITVPAFDTTTGHTLSVCVMARGAAGLDIDVLRIGVQE